jgi:malonate transporter
VNNVVLIALLPVMGMILLGLSVGRARWLGPGAVRRLSSLVFMLLTPVLLFRAMSRVHVEQLDPTPALAYTLAMALVFGAMLRMQGLSQRGAVLALAATYGNTVMIGIPLVSLAWGEAGLVTLFTLIPIHSLLLMTTATVVLEFAAARAQAIATPDVAARVWAVGLRALGKAFVHPVPIPIVAGLLFAQTGLVIPPWLDLPMMWLGNGFGPLALFLVGVSLSSAFIGKNLRAALMMTAIKNLVAPVLACALGWAFGMTGLPLAVMVVTAALPVGANAFLFSQRYGVAREVVTATVGVSTAISAVTVSCLLLLFRAP